MRLVRFASCTLAVLTLAAAAQAGVRPPAHPTGVRPFLLRVGERPADAYSRTPSFAWKPSRNAASYEFEVATSPSFGQGTVVWSESGLRTPAVSIPVSLPWMTGNPFALWAHVRAVSPKGSTSDWSDPYGFNTRWTTTPKKLPGAEIPGLLQWTLVDGATAYDVWLVDVGKVIRTRTNVADEREYYSFHHGSPWPDVVHWRVRAVRRAYGNLANRIPSVSYGPWSSVQTSRNPAFAGGPLQVLEAVSEVTSVGSEDPAPHRLTPSFVFTGDQALDGKRAELYRVYVFSDEDCVNLVFKGAVTGGPTYAPRMTGPLALPSTTTDLALARNTYLKDGAEGQTYMADGSTVLTTESDKPFSSDPPSSDPSATPPDNESTAPLPSTPTETGAPVDLWDSGWPNGRYYWTVVPLEARQTATLTTYLRFAAVAGATTISVNSTTGLSTGALLGTGTTQEILDVASMTETTMTLRNPLKYAHPAGAPVSIAGTAIEYRELETPQDACAGGRVGTFGKVSEPALVGGGAPFATGLSPTGRLVEATRGRPTFYGSPLVAWQPALGADQYQLQWSKTRYPWRPYDPVTKERFERLTYATSSVLDRTLTSATGTVRTPLQPGTWYYRVRGINFALPGGARAMSWSDPVAIKVAKPVFKIKR